MTKSAKEGTRPSGTTLGIDLGGTKILAGAIGEDGQVAGRGKVKTPFDGDSAALTAALLAACDAALAEAQKTRADVTAVGLAAPGPTDAGEGMAFLRVNRRVSWASALRVLEILNTETKARLAEEGHDPHVDQ